MSRRMNTTTKAQVCQLQKSVSLARKPVCLPGNFYTIMTASVYLYEDNVDQEDNVSPGSFGIEKAETFATPMPANPVTVTFLR
jgi:hypothetical protein